MAQSRISYHVSSNGSAGDWSWDVTCDGEIVARGLAPDRVKARMEALLAAKAYIGKSAVHPGS
jgi:hypothetical protein